MKSEHFWPLKIDPLLPLQSISIHTIMDDRQFFFLKNPIKKILDEDQIFIFSLPLTFYFVLLFFSRFYGFSR
ncbi:hypothetical protein EUGRSUZ_F03203 [Eucalyptus grandis]|uniref:Uncharacterized protein n=2 Tax=Eucalyptus grandis TaxID=71139 RepID=A0A059BV44_EUCGR|nr:hypothetical protein EUGRSUZ_F03203 [Eucalyptus grandis]